jgi:hypothetical protein
MYLLEIIVAEHFFFITDSNIPPGTVLFTNGVPYTYQNGMAIFQSPEGSFPVPQPQASISSCLASFGCD